MVVIYMAYKRELLNTLLKALGILIVPIGKKIYERTFSASTLKILDYFEKKQSLTSTIYIPYAVAITTGSVLVLSGTLGNF